MSCQNQPYQSFKDDLKATVLPWDDIKLTRQANRGRAQYYKAIAWQELFEYATRQAEKYRVKNIRIEISEVYSEVCQILQKFKV